jgi:hypothetical protein
MIGKLALAPSQVNSNDIQFIKSHKTIHIIYINSKMKLTSLNIVVPIKPPSVGYYPLRYINKGLTVQLEKLEYSILHKWNTLKQPVYKITKDIHSFLNTAPKSMTSLIVEIIGIWETRFQYGVIFKVGSI